MLDLIIKYFTEGLTKNELPLLENWISESIENKKIFLEIQDIWFVSNQANIERDCISDSKQAYQAFLQKIHQSSNQNIQPVSSKKKTMNIFFKIAAIVIVVILSGCFWLYLGHKHTSPVDVVIRSSKGTNTSVKLPDGTLVWLNAASTLTYPKNFGRKQRKVILSGEAYFEVHHDGKHPFMVSSGKFCVKDIGTKFDVKNYQGDQEAVVCLLEGKVGLTSSITDSVYYLSPNQKAVINPEKNQIKISSAQADKLRNWVTGNLFFDEEPLSDVAKKLERKFNVNITIKDKSIRNIRFYGDFGAQDQNIQNILETLSYTRKFSFKIKNQAVELYAYRN